MNYFSPGITAQRLKILLFVFFGFSLTLCATTLTASATERFPLYLCIRDNVKFWEDVYSRYSSQRGILHDKEHLNRVYSVVNLVSWDLPGSSKINNALIKIEKNKIDEILAHLGSGKKPRTTEEKRIAALFPRQRHTTFHKARENVRLQIGQSDRFYEGVIRSGRYLAHFRSILAEHGLPPELVYLPHVESSFNPKAYSKAGASGLWQFTRSTGQDYLTINNLVDERNDPYLATHAAAALLKENYSQLQSWPLALTAYNYGRSGMLRALKEKGSYEQIFKSYDQGYFKFASRNFYSEFLAATRVAKRLGGHPKVRLERPESTVTFRLKNEIPTARLIRSLGLSQENFRRLNPALLQPVIEGNRSVPKGYLVRLPARKQTIAQTPRIKSTPKHPTQAVKAQIMARPSSHSGVHYAVRKGDTVLSIARQFQVSSKDLLALNGLHGDTSIKIGEKLRIPTSESKIIIKRPETKRKTI
jgi:membrane-bound lytic murein transglycosylase D